MSKDNYIKLPRLYVDQELKENMIVSFGPEQTHYLKNVMRRKKGDSLRLFNGRSGEWLVSLIRLEKKSATAWPEKQLRPQAEQNEETHLVFTPLKKARMDFLIEKAVELGVTHLHPVLTQNTEVRKINQERTRQQLIEAAEQCERVDIPALYALEKLENILGVWPKELPLYACFEREDTPALSSRAIAKRNTALLIGPEGGFTTDEKESLTRHVKIIPVSLGNQILRSETAALFALSVIKNMREK